MNVQGASVLSLLSGTEGLSNIQQGLLGGSSDQAGFASALMEQLGILQGSDSPDLAALQSFMDNASVEGGMQNFAAFFGKNLPVATTTTQDIDLDETLQTLADVLQQLQELDISSLPLQQPINAETGQDLQALTSKLQQDESTGIDELALANSAVAMPIAVPTDVNELVKQAEDDLGLSGLLGDVDKLASVQNTAVEVSAKPDELGMDFDRSFSSMLGNEQNSGKPQQDKSALDLKSKSELPEIDAITDGTDVKTSAAGIAGDIAKMAAVVRNESPTTSIPTNQSSMQKHLSDPGWHQELGEKLIWMNKQATPSVELRLNPEHLGPVLVKIDVSHDQATVAFTTQHQVVKDAIEAAIPKLKEMLQGQQLNLADVNVSQQQSEQRQSTRDFFQMASDQGRKNANDADVAETGAVNQSQSIVDEIEAGRAIASNGLLSLFA
jgi:flagellar hook-length control protein FliK